MAMVAGLLTANSWQEVLRPVPDSALPSNFKPQDGGRSSSKSSSSAERIAVQPSPAAGKHLVAVGHGPHTAGATTATTAAPSPPALHLQLQAYEQTLSSKLVSRFEFQRSLKRSDDVRPHQFDYTETLRRWPLPVPESCPSAARPDLFCTPNIGRDWKPRHRVFPISYSLPEELFIKKIPRKDQDCSIIVPRVQSSYKFRSQAAYREEYGSSYYCLTFKKGGWDVLRHYEIIAAGCMPYLVDIEYCPIYTLYHFPKKLVLEARNLPGVTFNCSAMTVQIDHSVFPKERYEALLEAVIAHARRHLTTKAMAKYVLETTGAPQAKKVLYFARAPKGVQPRAQGNYNTWTLFHGLRTLLGSGAVDYEEIPFLYQQSDALHNQLRPRLYGQGFGYAFMLPPLGREVNRSHLAARIAEKEFDLIIFADVSLMMDKPKRNIMFLDLVSAHYPKDKIVFLHVPDIAYPSPATIGYRVSHLYDSGVVFQREISDCAYYAPPLEEGSIPPASEVMKRCVWYHNKNCFDDVNVVDAFDKFGAKTYPWALTPQPRTVDAQ